MATYYADIDGGDGGDRTIKADSLKEAMAAAIEWAMEGDWPDSGCDVVVAVWTEDEEGEVAEYDKETVHIPSTEEKLDQWLEDEGEVLAESEGEWSTERLVRIGTEVYYTHPNGGGRGAHDRQCGDGVWRERPCGPTRKLERSEVRRILLNWGWEPDEVAAVTVRIE